MYVDPSGEFFTSTLLVFTVIGSLFGYFTSVDSGTNVLMGIIIGAIIGATVGAVATAGPAYFFGGFSSIVNKTISDITSTLYFGTNNFGSWEDYAVAFVVGGIIRGSGSIGLSKWGLDAVARPFLNQVTKMGTRGAEFNEGRFTYDVFTRTVTLGIGCNIQLFGLELNPLKAIIRGLFSGMGRTIYD